MAVRTVGVVDVGGSHVHAALAQLAEMGVRLGDRQVAPLDSRAERDALLDQLVAPLGRLRPAGPTVSGPRAPDRGADEWVVALPGPFDYEHGRGDFAGVGKFGSLAGVDLRAELARRLGVAGERVHFLNDAVAYGLGEWAQQPERPERFVCLTLGTGVGSAFLVAGEPVTSGPGVPPHGWAHLLTIDGGPLEDTVSTRAIMADHARRTGLGLQVRGLQVREIADAARRGDGSAGAAIGTALHALGRALGPGLAAFGAERLVVGGAIARSWDLLEPPLRAGLRAGGAGPGLALGPSLLLDDAPLLGAAEWLSRRPAASPAPRP